MKKIIFLTYVLVLSACGGGGTGDGYTGGLDTGDNIGEAEEEVVFNGVAIPMEELKNVSFKSREYDKYSLGVTNGVLSVVYANSKLGGTEVYYLDTETGRVTGVDCIECTEDTLNDMDRFNRSDVRGFFSVYGKRAGLKYADFGRYYQEIWDDGKKMDSYLDGFLGGISDKEVHQITEDVTFDGIATAVILSDWRENVDEYGSDTMFVDTNVATLSVDGEEGDYVLSMDFTKAEGDKWYKIDVSGIFDSDEVSASYSNVDNVEIKQDFVLGDLSQNSPISVLYNWYGEEERPVESVFRVWNGGLTGVSIDGRKRSIFWDAMFGGKVAQ